MGSEQEETDSRSAESRLQALIDAAPFGAHTYVVEDDGRLVFRGFNKAADRILGFSHVSLIGLEILDAFPSLQGTDIPDRYRRVALTGEAYAQDQIDYKDGRVAGAFEFVAAQTGRREMTVFFRDISERRRVEEEIRDSERRYRELFEANPHPMWVYDLETLRFLAVNDAAVHHYGYTREEFLAMTIRDIRPPEDITRLMESIEKSRRVEGLDDAGIWRHRLKDGSIRSMDITAHSLVFQGRRAELVLAHDVTEQLRAAQLLRESHAVLEQRVQERTADLQSAVAALREEVELRRRLEGQILEVSDQEQRRIGQDLHDGICQMLTAVAFLCDSLEQRLRTKDEDAAGRAYRVKQLVERAIAESRRVARGLHPVQLEEIGLMAALRDLSDSHTAAYGTRCRVACSGDVSMPDMAKATHLYRIAQEACSNAQRHGKATDILISLKRLPNGSLRLAVDDNGRGLGPRDPSRPGGMGLHIMNYRAAAMNAEVAVKVRRSGGTRVVCIVPPDEAGRAPATSQRESA